MFMYILILLAILVYSYNFLLANLIIFTLFESCNILNPKNYNICTDL